MAAEKHNLLLVDRSEAKLRQLSDALSLEHVITAHYVALDLTEPDAAQHLFAETERLHLQVDWLINNAGIGSAGIFMTLDLRSDQNMVALNVTGVDGPVSSL